MRMKINKLKTWKKEEKVVGQRYFSRSQDKFYVRNITLTVTIIKGIFPDDLKLQRLLQYIKLTTAVILVIIGQYLCYLVFLKS